jgi:hypothetical protein
MNIPAFDMHGIVPPIRPGLGGAERDRSPYRATMQALCLRFGTSGERRAILRGLLRLRSELRANGFADGFQWIDGSFVEDVEATRNRSPHDVDVVSFLRVGDPATLQDRARTARALFASAECKRLYQVDHYVIQLDLPLDAATAQLIAYWYSMWSHRREDSRWKGFVQVELSDDDPAALRWLDESDARNATGESDVP